MKRLFHILALVALSLPAFAQNAIKVEAPNVVGADERFNVTFIIEGEKSPSDFSWSQGDDFQLVWGPQKGTSTSIQVINGKRTLIRPPSRISFFRRLRVLSRSRRPRPHYPGRKSHRPRFQFRLSLTGIPRRHLHPKGLPIVAQVSHAKKRPLVRSLATIFS